MSSVLVIGLVTGLMLTVRFHQMVQRGEALGQRMVEINRGVMRYMRDHAAQLLALPSACSTLSANSTHPVDCEVAIGGTSVINGLQPTIAELAQLHYVHDDDRLYLPHSEDLAKDQDTGLPVPPQLAVKIERLAVHDPGAAGVVSPAPPAVPASAASRARRATFPDSPAEDDVPIATFTGPGKLPVVYNRMGGLESVFHADCRSGTRADITRRLHNGPAAMYEGTGEDFCNEFRDGKVSSVAVAVAKEAWADDYGHGTLRSIFGIDCRSSRPAMYQAGARLLKWNSGAEFCQRYLSLLVDPGKIKAMLSDWHARHAPFLGSSGGMVPRSQPWGLQSIVFNTQPYYANSGAAPFGAGAQLAAAWKAAGHQGRLAMKGAAGADNQMLSGPGGAAPLINPVRSASGEGLGGVLAVTGAVHGGGGLSAAGAGAVQAGNVGCGAGSNTMCLDGKSLPTAAWDFNMQNIENLGTLEAKVIRAQDLELQAPGTQGTPLMPGSVLGAALTLRGDLVMSENSQTIVDRVTAQRLRTKRVDATDLVEIGVEGRVPHKSSMFVHDNVSIRLPRAIPGQACQGERDLALSYAGRLLRHRTSRHDPDEVLTVNGRQFHRFFLYCDIDQGYVSGVWRNAEHESLRLQHSGYEWAWNHQVGKSGGDVDALPAIIRVGTP